MPRDQLRRVVHIAVCGQMHGVMFWRQGDHDQTRLYCHHHQLFFIANGLKYSLSAGTFSTYKYTFFPKFLNWCSVWVSILSGDGWSRNSKDQLVVGGNVSSLYTWQDGRCSPDFLSSLPQPRSHLRKEILQIIKTFAFVFLLYFILFYFSNFHFVEKANIVFEVFSVFSLSTGYGCATIFWLCKHKPEFLSRFDRWVVKQY